MEAAGAMAGVTHVAVDGGHRGHDRCRTGEVERRTTATVADASVAHMNLDATAEIDRAAHSPLTQRMSAVAVPATVSEVVLRRSCGTGLREVVGRHVELHRVSGDDREDRTRLRDRRPVSRSVARTYSSPDSPLTQPPTVVPALAMSLRERRRRSGRAAGREPHLQRHDCGRHLRSLQPRNPEGERLADIEPTPVDLEHAAQGGASDLGRLHDPSEHPAGGQVDNASVGRVQRVWRCAGSFAGARCGWRAACRSQSSHRVAVQWLN